MKKTIIVLSIIVLTFIIYSSSFSQSFGWAPWCRWNYFASSINMTPEQIEELTNIQQEFYQNTSQLQNDIMTKSLELRTLLTNSTVDDEAILAKQSEVFALQQNLNEDVLKYRLKAQKILTPEQRALLPQGYNFGFGMGRGYGYSMDRRMGLGLGRGMGWGNGFGRGWGRGGGWGRGFYNSGMRGNIGAYPRWWR